MGLLSLVAESIHSTPQGPARAADPQWVLVRHGDDGPQGAPDPPLSPLGRAQAQVLADSLADQPFDALYTSPRRRALQTAAILGARLGLQPTVVEGLGEVPCGPRALVAFLRLARLSRWGLPTRRVVVVTHGGTLRCLLFWLGGWRRLPWLWRQAPHCRPFYSPCRASLPGFRGPLALFLLGLALGLILAPGPWPGPATLASYLLALLAYGLARHLARRGQAGLVVAAIVGAALAAVPLAFGPSPLSNRKVTAFNAWAFGLAAHLPALVPVAPHPNGAAGVLATGLGLAGAAALYGCGWRRRLSGLGVLLVAAALALTASRAGWLAGVAAVGILVARRGRRAVLIGLGLSGLAFASLLAAAGPAPPGQPALLSPESLWLRLEQWDRSLALLRERPLTGLGLGRFPALYAQAVAGSAGRAFKTPNNAWLELWADAGVLGLLAGAWAAWRAGEALPALTRRGTEGWPAVGLGAGLIAFAAHGLVESNTAFVWAAGGRYGHLASPLPYALLGLLAGLRQRQVLAEFSTSRPASHRRATARAPSPGCGPPHRP